MLLSQPSHAAAPPPGMFAAAQKSASGKIFYAGRRRARNFYPQAVPASKENAPLYGESASGATVGRYISSDPIGLAGGLNTFNYPQNPVMNIDPNGNEMTMTLTGGGTALAACLANPACATALTLGAPVVGAVAAGVAGAYVVAWSINKVEGCINEMSRKSDKEKASDAPSFAKAYTKDPKENCDQFARSILEQEYGPSGSNPNPAKLNDRGPGSEYSQIKKWCERSGK